MKTKTILRAVTVVSLLAVVFSAIPVSAQTQNLYTSASITNITGGSVVNGLFSSDVQLSIANSGPSSLLGVMGANIYVRYDPTVVSFVSVGVVSGFFDNPYGGGGAENPCSIATGSTTATACVHFQLTQQPGAGPVYNRTGVLATIHWMGVAAGQTELGIITPNSELISSDGQSVPFNSVSSATVNVYAAGVIVGHVYRQGYKGTGATLDVITVSAAVGGGQPTPVSVDSTGYFTVAVQMWGTYSVKASAPGYLTAKKDSVYVVGAVIDVGATTLRAGDVNADNVVNIFDLVRIAVWPNRTDALADINDDGTVDIYDLTLAAGNYNRSGPTAW